MWGPLQNHCGCSFALSRVRFPPKRAGFTALPALLSTVLDNQLCGDWVSRVEVILQSQRQGLGELRVQVKIGAAISRT